MSTISVTDATANSITLTWTASESATQFKIYYTSNDVTFYPAPLPSNSSTGIRRWRTACWGEGKLTHVASSLVVCLHFPFFLTAENSVHQCDHVHDHWPVRAHDVHVPGVCRRLHQLRCLLLRSRPNGHHPDCAYGRRPPCRPEQRRLKPHLTRFCLSCPSLRPSQNVAAVFNVSSTTSTSTSIKVAWKAGSTLTAYYLVYGQRTTASRDLDLDTWTLLQNSTNTTVTVSNLASGATYTFRVDAVAIDGTTNSAEYSFQTLSSTAGAGVPEGCTCALQLPVRRNRLRWLS